MEEAPVRLPHGMTPAGLHTPQPRLANASDGPTIVVNCLFNLLDTLTEHVRVDVNDIDGGLPVTILFSCVIEDTKRNVGRSSGDVNATNGTFVARSQGGDKLVSPQPVHPKRYSVVHQVVRGRQTIEHAVYEGYLRFFWDCLEAE